MDVEARPSLQMRGTSPLVPEHKNLTGNTTLLRRLVRLAKMRWRIEHDYREMKHGLGLDHFEGRTWRGWHHHVTLVTAAHAFLTLRRHDPKVEAPA
ncbi:transposase [Kitasatospora sp. NPDC056184]|uniref:transposase n=1 Tax=Kitasatospora sp. NPDC056184 TaxID=3345738 RepID=UPI0035D9BCDD